MTLLALWGQGCWGQGRGDHRGLCGGRGVPGKRGPADRHGRGGHRGARFRRRDP